MLESNQKKISDAVLLDRLRDRAAVVITGTGGSGKSFLLKYLMLSLVNSAHGRIPIYFEFRTLNDMESPDLVDQIFRTITEPGGSITRSKFLKWLRSRNYVLVLDGFDELNKELRPEMDGQLNAMRRKFPNNSFVVSSRSDERFDSWSQFTVLEVTPLSKRSVLALLTKLPYDQEIKTKFKNNIRNGLFEQHESFLSSPLLATMMLLTYEQFAEIPDKIHLFYEQAFETLFIRHDSTKEAGYQRRRNVDLAINHFRNCFAAFCASTYTNEKMEFTKSDLLEYTEKALAFERESVDPAGFVADLVDSVCMIQREGLYFTFTHRSFQEYFAAVFATSGRSESFALLLAASCERASDAVVRMAFDMNRAFMEKSWIIPSLREVISRATGAALRHPVEVTSILYAGNIVISKGEGELGVSYDGIPPGSDMHFVWRLRDLYPELFWEVYPPGQLGRSNEGLAEQFELRAHSTVHRYGRMVDTAPFPIVRDDWEWLSQTWIGEFGRRIVGVLTDVLDHVEASVDRTREAGKLLLR
ncbi:MAG: NACHT domain-containing protein [Bauldia sp.]|nr:NACHT domain-containing protein [Bauldia sp.]